MGRTRKAPSGALVTGASSGIGRATALALADRRVPLVLTGRSAEVLEEVAQECRARGGTASVAELDVRDGAISGGATGGSLGWMIGIPWQGKGYASEAAVALLEWVQRQGVDEIGANIQPGHRASDDRRRARGLHQTEQELEGERVWRA